MQITHEQAHKLIQLDRDAALNPQEQAALSAHISDCVECRLYAQEIREVENILLPLLKKHWTLEPIPLPLGAILGKRSPRLHTSTILATRTAAVGVVLLAFLFSAWQFALSGRQAPGRAPVGVLPVPTPVTQSTSTKFTAQSCAEMLYVVQDNDTLKSIAQQFATSPEQIMALNNLPTAMIQTKMELIIPICNFTPTGTVRPTLLSTRYTPSLRPTTSTPGG